MQDIHFKQRTGHRRATPGSIASAKISRLFSEEITGREFVVTRTMALQVAKRAAAAMGLKSTKIAMIDQLFAFTKPRDWTDEGVRPVIWPSNETLARRLGITISTMKHHLTGLQNAGLVGYSDHPTYQRKGIRDNDGRIIQAYGIDLSPLITRYAELLELAETAEHQARLRQKLSYQRTSLRREIEAIIHSAIERGAGSRDTWQSIRARYDRLRERQTSDNMDRAETIEALEVLRDEAESAFEELFDSRNFDSAVSIFRPLQTTADLPQSESCKDERNCASAQSVDFLGASGAMALEEKPDREARRVQEGQNDIENISLPLIRDACPQLATWLPHALGHWSTLRRAGSELCTLVSINPQVYREAQDLLGPDLAVVALALTVERTARGDVTNPGGYLRTLSKRGQAGALHLSRSLFALAAQAPVQHRLV
ncbi:replication protein C [Agrobacterium tumefaciens]|uniref:plasmid replication protein RepC n=1 Tax=Agrobacterium tumefaciens TaxID=358 RepID=UPI001571884E|nr:replication protein C [Agrobacterium tumefaciens]